MSIKVVLMDKDGTIIDFFKVWGKMLKPVMDRLYKKYKLESMDSLKIDIMQLIGVKDGIVDGNGLFACKSFEETSVAVSKYLKTKGIDISPTLLERDLVNEFAKEIDKLDTIPGFTDVRSLVLKLKEDGIHVGIATTDEYSFTKKFLEKLEIEDEIEIISAAGSKLPIKPDPKLIEYISNIYSVANCEIAMVGDTLFDMNFAKESGALAIGVLSGTGLKEDLEKNADYIIGSIDNLYELITKINN